MRAVYLDSLRGLAVVWMIIFHICYDLRIFGLINWDFSEGFWYAFPRVIAFTFLFCVGISLKFVHGEGLNRPALLKRCLKLGLAAGAVSLGTYLIFPQQWIYFGTLHCIFFGSLFGAILAPYKKSSWILMILIIIAQYSLGYDIKWVSSILQKPSMDFIPIYPWFWAVLLGINLAPYLSRISLLNRLKPMPFLNFLGQHSLKIYLIHQPLLFGLLSGFKYFVSK